jgi:hypothetical protein
LALPQFGLESKFRKRNFDAIIEMTGETASCSIALLHALPICSASARNFDAIIEMTGETESTDKLSTLL